MPTGKYVKIGDSNVYLEGDSIHWATANPAFHGDGVVDTAGLGLNVVFSSNPRSVNYHPRYWNRCVRALNAAGVTAPELRLIPEHKRELKYRPGVIEEVRAEREEPVEPADLAVFGWATCKDCGCVTDPRLTHRCAGLAAPGRGVAGVVQPRRLEESERMAAVVEALKAGNRTAGAVRSYLNAQGIACDRKWIQPLMAPALTAIVMDGA